jgi:subtilase family serine protease
MRPSRRFTAIRFAGLAMILLTSSIGTLGCASDSDTTTAANATPVTRLQSRPTTMDPLMDKAKPAPSDHVMQLEVEFALRNKAEFDQLMADIQNPHSKRYQQWLTAEEMHRRFGESRAEFDAVRQWITAQELTITDQSFGSNDDFIRFKGTVARVNKAFRVHIMEPQFELYVPKEDPVIPAQFAGVISRVNGLDNVGFRS